MNKTLKGARRGTAIALSLCLALSPALAACQTQQQAQDQAEEEMDRLPDAAAEGLDKLIALDYDEEGAYTLAFSEGDLLAYDEIAESGLDQIPEVSGVDDAEMDREAPTPDDAEPDEADAADDPEAASPEQDGDAASEEPSPSEAEADDEPVAAAFADLTQDDLRVTYNMPVAMGEDGIEYEEREANVTSFANDGAAVTLGFSNPDAGEAYVYYYTVDVPALSACAVAQVVVPSSDEAVEVDPEAQLAAIDYAPDFADGDVALPEGLELTEEGFVLTNEAPAVVAKAVEGAPELAEDMDRSAQGDTFWVSFNAKDTYAAKGLGFVKDNYKSVYNYGKGVYDIYKNVSSGNWIKAIGSVKGFLGLLGVFGGGGSAGVSNEQLLEELHTLEDSVADLRTLTARMYDELDEVTKQSYRNGLQSFDNALFALNTNAAVVERMFQAGAQLAEERGLTVPGDDATAEEEHAFNIELVKLMRAESAAGNPKFSDLDQFVTDLRNNFTLVAGELAKSPDMSPLTAYKNYWNTYFNFETQGYYLRAAYAGNAEFQLRRAFAALAAYYHIGSEASGGVYDQLAVDMGNALAGLEQVPLGDDPSGINVYNWRKISVYSGTFGRTITGVGLDLGGSGESRGAVAEDTMRLYVSKLHGRTPEEDLRLAGLWSDNEWARFKWDESSPSWMYSDLGHGIGFNTRKSGSKCYADVILWDGTIRKGATTYNGWNPIDKIERSGTTGRIPFVAFSFA